MPGDGGRTKMLRKVLIVESDLSVRNYLAELFQKRALEYDTVESGADALDAVRRSSFDLCLLDINMHDVQGFDIAKAIRARSSSKIVLMTGSYSLDIIENAWTCAEYLLLKPFTPAELMNVLNMLFFDCSYNTQ